jgi:phage repressor protein C with HTH and peptisase S24 domain
MEPALKPGDLIVGWKWFRPRAGQIVVARTPERLLIKRIKRIDGAGIWIEGDNASASRDSRQFGTIASDALAARKIMKL